MHHWFQKFIAEMAHYPEYEPSAAVMACSIAVAVLGISLAFVMYLKKTHWAATIAKRFPSFYRLSFNKFYFDEIYLFVTKKIIFRYISAPVAWFDRHIVDGSMNGIAWVTNYSSNKIKGFQSGQVQQYAFVFISGAILLSVVFIYLFSR